MDPKLAFWTAALVPTTAIVACAFAGWRAIRRGDVERHRRWMNLAILSVAVFLASYVFKVLFLGKEDFELWSPGAILFLRIHETIVLAMVVAGAVARAVARKLAPGRPAAGPAPRRRHRLAGRTAAMASVLALATAAMVLAGMYMRQ